MKHYDFVVIGGGIVGLCAAIALRKEHYEVAIVDAGSLTMDDMQNSRVYAINHASQKLLDKLEIWSCLTQEEQAPYQAMQIWENTSAGRVEFDSRMVARDRLGTIVEEAVLKKYLLALTKQLEVDLFPGEKISQINIDAPAVKLDLKMQPISAGFLIIADGAYSNTRENLKVPATSWSYHQSALVASVKTQLPHNKVAFQVFSQGSPLALLPLSSANECSMVWSLSEQKARRLLDCDISVVNKQLKKTFGNKLGELEIKGQLSTFPLRMRHTKKYSGRKWILLGDCAHTFHPLAGLGLNVGLQDLNQWMELLSRSKQRYPSAKILGQYHRQRSFEVWQIIILIQFLKELFNSPFLTSIRGLGLKAFNKSTLLKKLCIHIAG
jgi:2-octaprenylphenol hydroxylase